MTINVLLSVTKRELHSRGRTEGENTVKGAVAEGVGEEEVTGLLAAHPADRGPRPRALAPDPLGVVGVVAAEGEVGTTDACSIPRSPCQRHSRWAQIFPTMPGLGPKSILLIKVNFCNQGAV